MGLDPGLLEAREGGGHPLAETAVGVLRDDQRDCDRAARHAFAKRRQKII